MVHRKGLVSAAVFAALAVTGIAHAESTVGATNDGLAIRPLFLVAATEPAITPDTKPASPAVTTAPATGPTTDAPPAAVPSPLMYYLGQANMKDPLDKAGITIAGYIEGGYTASFQHPPGNVIQGRFVETKNERIVLDQADIYVDRPVDYAKAATNHTIDIGAHLEGTFGWDSGVIHSSGIFDNPATIGVTDGFYKTRTAPENQFDIPQAYIDVALPIGTGLRIRMGKFYTPLGYETINPTTNPFYSRSFLFTYAIPLNQTGIIGEYKLNDDIVLDAGVTRGWNQSLRDNNGAVDFLGDITWAPQGSDELKKWAVILNVSEGPQGTHDNGDYWSVFDLVVKYQATPAMLLALNVDYGDAPHIPGLAGSAQWYGAAAYISYALNSYVTLNGRGEWYDDQDGATLGLVDGLYEATAGATITPFPDNDIAKNLLIRPEVRVDYSDKNYFNAGTKHTDVTFGIDAIFKF